MVWSKYKRVSGYGNDLHQTAHDMAGDDDT